MTFGPTGLSRDLMGLGEKTASPYQKSMRSTVCAQISMTTPKRDGTMICKTAVFATTVSVLANPTSPVRP